MTLRHLPLLAVSILSLASCATPPVKARDSLFGLLQGKNVVSCAYFADTKIGYMEERFLREEHQSADFSVAWQPNAEMSAWFASTLLQNGIAAVDLSTSAGSTFGSAFVEASAAPFTGPQLFVEPTRLREAPAGLTDELAQQLKTKSNLLVELIFTNLSAGNPVGASARMQVFVHVRVTDLASRQVVYAQRVMARRDVKLQEDIKRTVEADGLAPVKSFIESAVKALPNMSLSKVEERMLFADEV